MFLFTSWFPINPSSAPRLCVLVGDLWRSCVGSQQQQPQQQPFFTKWSYSSYFSTGRGIINIIIGNSRRNINDDMVPFQWIDGRHSVCVVVTSLAYLLYFLWPCPDPWMDSSAVSLVTMLTSKTRTKSSESSSYLRHPPLLLNAHHQSRPSVAFTVHHERQQINSSHLFYV